MHRLKNFSETPSILDNYLRQLRDKSIHSDPDQFRENLRRVGRIIGYEISKVLAYTEKAIETPMQLMSQRVLSDKVVAITILRAGLPLHEGILSAIPTAENGFISAYRKHNENGGFEIEVGYVACPNLEGKVLILNDPMLATGSSFLNALEAVKAYGKPKEIHLVAVISSREGVERLLTELDPSIRLWIGAIDPYLDENKYILPGLGDAGDLAFGEKIQS
jgi:uracil phosphoribosyltransferase